MRTVYQAWIDSRSTIPFADWAETPEGQAARAAREVESGAGPGALWMETSPPVDPQAEALRTVRDNLVEAPPVPIVHRTDLGEGGELVTIERPLPPTRD
jgi:hypothetical protein